MESPNNRGGKAPIRHLLLPTQISHSRSESHLIELLAKGLHKKPQTSLSIAKATGCSPQTNGKALLLKTMPTYLIEYGEVELVPN